MFDYDKKHIPLLLERSMGYSLYIVENIIHVAEEIPEHATSPYKAFKLLTDLYNNDLTRNAIPKRYHKYLSIEDDIAEKYGKNVLVGSFDQGTWYIADLEIQIDASVKKPVSFHNICYSSGAYRNHLVPEDILVQNLSFSPEEVFFLLANILTNDRCFHFHLSLQRKKLTSLDDLEITEDMGVYAYRTYLEDGEAIINLNKFALAYLKDLRTNLIAGSVKPYTIQHYSGTQTLAMLGSVKPVQEYLQKILHQTSNLKQLTQNERLLYYTFLQLYPAFIINTTKAKAVYKMYSERYYPLFKPYLPNQKLVEDELNIVDI